MKKAVPKRSERQQQHDASLQPLQKGSFIRHQQHVFYESTEMPATQRNACSRNAALCILAPTHASLSLHATKLRNHTLRTNRNTTQQLNRMTRSMRMHDRTINRFLFAENFRMGSCRSKPGNKNCGKQEKQKLTFF